MESRNIIIVGIATLIVGLVLGVVFAPSLAPNGRDGGMMGGDANMMSENIDRHFIEQMIPHHEGAIAMAKLALEKSSRPEIISLSNGIIEAQTREINDMKSWYGAWFGSVPRESSMMGHGMHMQGMEGDLDELTVASDFDQEFLAQMIVHHEMAVMMAEMLKSSTERDEMKRLADQIITSQTREIELMKSWTRAWTTSANASTTLEANVQ